MKTILTLIVVVLAACGASPAPGSSTARAETTSTTVQEPDRARAMTHLSEHVTYPASRDQLLAACNDGPEFTLGEQEWFATHLPQGNYASAEEAANALGW